MYAILFSEYDLPLFQHLGLFQELPKGEANDERMDAV